MRLALLFLIAGTVLQAQVVSFVRRVPPAAAGGEISSTLLTSGVDTGDRDPTTASISPAANSDLLLCFCSAKTSGTDTDVDAGIFSGPTGITWNTLLAATDRRYGTRRKCDYFHGDVDASPGSGTVTIDCDIGTGPKGGCSTPEDGSAWVIVEYTGLDPTTPLGTSYFAAGSGTSASVTVGETPDAGDALATCFAWEDTDTLTGDADFGSTEANPSDTNTGVRQLFFGTNLSPPSSPVPDASGTGSNSWAAFSVILEVAP